MAPSSFFKVVINHEEQYRVIPADTATPDGWREAGKSGTLPEVATYLKSVWGTRRPDLLEQVLKDAETAGRR